ncbi:bifunctional diaminohydroxyphosphoribosylaminopyrimidine deaminase/5-amino-6-(5-phosphoribosylamino)uracil reductase RibD [Clostridium sp. D2Q-11]|uniref:Riboflavin biosynthesis protein RibD n=1 Tax=Anaeromonas frigoriresistens TaxID=2683708 RepID=A0A942Z6X6_9FIRM|nr:bifunctional diaminohydroxyphosphoribosylaminopyrimidine deaminase/5-amino-6-(5-phosphoribosylamino)uracil reductase RibD [Anaeromonas frigoriresistens]MBS4538941.1 bifunctional diaminohydroxyphosphoribosylaminopyrimidine deaminase/5-amino-6-(5-phosphoribosylamino)uracil reductase RibD [Anaeromonas frigoriresistens]
MDIKYMKSAIELSKKGKGYTNPNPLVGAVIVKEDKIIGEGFHELYGGPHAEVNAFANAKEDIQGATMYVTLEPCSHFGKTPPCANNIVEKGISKVVIGMRDPNPLVAGKGIEILRNNGIEVKVGILEDEIKKVNEIFIKYITENKPFCILKTAMTLDGKIASSTGDSKWITNEVSRHYVHQIRHRVSAIMVGIGTVLSDDPQLTTRLDDGGVDPIRVIVDTNGRIPLDAKVLNIKSKAKTIIATTEKIDKEKMKAIKEKGAEVIITPLKNERVDLDNLMFQLGKMKIDSVLLEGGSTLNYSALEQGIVDKVLSFIAPKIIGGKDAKTPVGGKGREKIEEAFILKNMTIARFSEDIIIEGYLGKEGG